MIRVKMNYESWISFRYLSAKKEPFLALINFVAIAGVAIGVTALIIVIGVMTGFDRDLREKIIGTNAHIVIEKETGVQSPQKLEDKIKLIDGVEAATPYVQGPLFLEYDNQVMNIVARGVDPKTAGDVTKIKEYLVKGSLEDLSGNGVIIGSELSNYLGKKIGDILTVIAPVAGRAGNGWRHELVITGIFSSGMYDYDMTLALISLPKAQEIFGLPKNTVNGIALKLKDVYAAPEIKKEIYQAMGYSFLVKTWIDSNRNFFAALKLEKFAMFIILTLIVLVASFNIVSTLIVTVTSKIKDIGILKAIGVPRKAIERIFVMKGMVIGIVGTFFGFVGGVGLSLLLKKYQFIKLPQEIYYIDRLPILLELGDLLMIAAAAFVISYCATIYPAKKAGALEPVEALRYE
ncbi:MAG: ABC transporter permease [Candidatus Omnitrophica bacterium]|nr:ABC transporter permease [Candidatus Omnitrophota bacterium]